MLIPLLTTVLLAAPASQPTTPATEPLPALESTKGTAGDHGKLNWFDGTYEEALKSAKESKKLIFLDFWTDWCGYCKKMDAEAFSADSVVTEMNDLICVSIDAESEAGSALKEKFGVRGFPTLLFLNADGTARDVIGGYMPTDSFHAEVKRIKSGEGTISGLFDEIDKWPLKLELRFQVMKKLIAFNDTKQLQRQKDSLARIIQSNKGFAPQSVYSRWDLKLQLESVGMTDLAKRQVHAIRKLDPGGESMPMRRLAFDKLAATVETTADVAKLEEFLAKETYTEILFDGWRQVYGRYDREAKKSRDHDVISKSRANSRRAAKELWKHTPKKYHASLGNQIAWGFYEAAEDLDATEKAWALEVAEIAMKASEDDVNVIDTFACCLFINGKVKEATIQIDRCIELDPENKVWRERRDEFTGTQG